MPNLDSPASAQSRGEARNQQTRRALVAQHNRSSGNLDLYGKRLPKPIDSIRIIRRRRLGQLVFGWFQMYRRRPVRCVSVQTASERVLLSL